MSYGDTLLLAVLKVPAAPLALVAWLVVAVGTAREVVVRVRAGGRTPWWGALLFAFAFGLRLWVPAGPMDFAEGDRFQTLWQDAVELQPDYMSVHLLASLWRVVGGGYESYTRFVTPAMGAAACVVTVVLARRVGAAPGLSWLAGMLVAVWPPHVRYSASSGLGVVGSLLLASFLAVVLAPAGRGAGRVVFAAALAVLAAETRSEYGLVVALSLVAARGAGWSVRELVGLAILGALPGAAFLASTLQPTLFVPSEAGAKQAITQFLAAPHFAPVTWVAAGFAGLLWGLDRRWGRLGAMLAITSIVLPHLFSGGERNPVWGAWRHYLAAAPFLAAGIARLLSKLPPLTVLRVAVAVLVLAPGLTLAGQLTMRVDVQEQYAFVRRTAPGLVRSGRTPVVLARAQGDVSIDGLETLSFLALQNTFGPLRLRQHCQALAPDPSRLDVWTRPATLDCPHAPPPASQALFLGMYRPPGLVARPIAGFTETIAVMPMTGFHQTQCAEAVALAEGIAAGPCPVEFTWSEVAP